MLFGVPQAAPTGAVPWYQQPTYTGTGLLPSSSLVLGGAPASAARPDKQQQPAATAAESGGGGAAAAEEEYYCDACEKEFTQESQYRAHVATHVTCAAPDCSFVGSQRVVKEHMQMVHGAARPGKGGRDGEVTIPVVSLNTPEEIAAWRAARAKNWPSDANVAKKHEAAAQRQSRGQPDTPQAGRFG
eukprot:CAMPEP_0173394388 /NCGR_PEP_ID=MMETSP1356-20130122/27199_1 /TAXON_ID=77927 ORGANISM="Hemiselmis virescens, Strain PCC157" /NCGR_SAMPLE_ID=MMETSP1356 /ASSEMBLY_ACC=CAM_ASM_000847 /LENGTH=186 /DNA_ID=CAMNT_0014352733 /DNA_START=120 /DNA_END=676 /DNA_ORIENTATION=-